MNKKILSRRLEEMSYRMDPELKALAEKIIETFKGKTDDGMCCFLREGIIYCTVPPKDEALGYAMAAEIIKSLSELYDKPIPEVMRSVRQRTWRMKS